MSLVLFRHEFVKADVVDYVIFILVIMKLLFAMIKDEMMRQSQGASYSCTQFVLA